MELSELQKQIEVMENELIEKGGPFEYPQLLRVIKVNEELGELSRIILRMLVKTRKGDKLNFEEIKEELSMELVDTIAPLIGLANHFKVDLEKSFAKKLAINSERNKDF